MLTSSGSAARFNRSLARADRVGKERRRLLHRPYQLGHLIEASEMMLPWGKGSTFTGPLEPGVRLPWWEQTVLFSLLGFITRKQPPSTVACLRPSTSCLARLFFSPISRAARSRSRKNPLASLEATQPHRARLRSPRQCAFS